MLIALASDIPLPVQAQISPTLRRKPQQRSAQLKDIHQRARDVQPLGIFGDAAIAHVGKTKEALEHQEGMLDLGANARFAAVLALLNHVDPAAVAIPPMRHVAGSPRARVNDGALSLIRRVTPNAGFLAMLHSPMTNVGLSPGLSV